MASEREGRKQVEKLAERLAHLPIRAIYTSPLERAVETAEEVGRPHGLAPRREVELGEVQTGEWEGLEIAELERREDFRRYNQFRGGAGPAGGELMVETQARMIRRMQSLVEEHRDETVAIMSHGDPLRLVVAFYMGIPLDLLARFEISPASLSVVKVADWEALVTCVNNRGGEV